MLIYAEPSLSFCFTFLEKLPPLRCLSQEENGQELNTNGGVRYSLGLN